MTVAAATGITVSIARDPALVRTVRLVAACVARRTGQDEEFVEEIRLAVGEACALMLGRGAEDVIEPGPITVTMRLGERLTVDVSSSSAVSMVDETHSDIDGDEPWALLRGLIDDFAVEQDGGRTLLAMSWPLG